jgi:hypothetical protein
MPEAHIVLVRRDSAAIGAASAKTGWMFSAAPPEWWTRYARLYNEEQYKLIASKDPRIHTIWPHDYLAGNTEGLQQAAAACGLKWTKEAADLIHAGSPEDFV